ncbi:MAG: hypothetical protein HYV09_21320 [Deltaproteobacteria bacterium]|nr:hypothetical protein [Deltaproteobacteria bacterium]
MTARRRVTLALVKALGGLPLVACANVQDLGATPSPTRDAGPQGLELRDGAPTPREEPVVDHGAPGECPRSMPVDGASCSVDVGWCGYRSDPAGGVASGCVCGADRRWTCLLMRDDHRRNVLPKEALPLTGSSCTEGAPCAEGVRCTVAGTRSCGCTSAGILLCTHLAQ